MKTVLQRVFAAVHLQVRMYQLLFITARQHDKSIIVPDMREAFLFLQV